MADLTSFTAVLELIKAIAPYIVALIGMLGGVYAAIRANHNQLTAAYFTKMTAAYERHWEAFTEFVYNPTDETRNAYAVAVYNAVLYSTEDIAKGIQVLHDYAVEYTRSGQHDMCKLDEIAGALEELLHDDVQRLRDRRRD